MHGCRISDGNNVSTVFVTLMLRLHYVPGSHGSQKRSSPWGLGHFCLRFQVLLSLATFSHCLSRLTVTDDRGLAAH